MLWSKNALQTAPIDEQYLESTYQSNIHPGYPQYQVRIQVQDYLSYT